MKNRDICEYSNLHFLTTVPGLGRMTIRSFLDKGFTATQIVENKEILQKLNINITLQNSIQELYKTFNNKAYISSLEKYDVEVISIQDEEYPQLLKDIPDAPILLYFQGDISLTQSTLPIALVGSRNMTNYGKYVCEDFIPQWTPYCSIVSGLALGIDSYVHSLTLENKGKAIAVIGSGLDRFSFAPKSNWRLKERIRNEGGVVISEYPPLTQPHPYHFPQRNRIISGLSKVVVVVEARQKSGALITAQTALDQGRDVGAVPGPIFSENSKGVHYLLKEGAHSMSCAQDLLDILHIENEQQSLQIYDLTQQEKKVLECIQLPQHIEYLVEKTGLSIGTLIGVLNKLEIKGCVYKVGPETFVRK